MNILIVKLSAIGDVIHTLPAVNALRARFPDARITWLVEEAASEIIESHEAVDRVLISKREPSKLPRRTSKTMRSTRWRKTLRTRPSVRSN